MPSVTVDGTTLSYSDTGGAGIPVVLLHPFPLNAAAWEPQVQALGDRFRLVAVDLKGFGDSDAPDDPAAYSMDSYADEVKGFIDHLGAERVVLVGLSMGGYVALAFHRRHGGSLAGLVLADTRAEADPPEGVQKRSTQQEQVRERGTGELIDALTTALLSQTTQSKKPDVVDTVKKVMDNPPAGFVGALEAMKNRPDSTEDLARISVPTLVLVGEEDAITPPEAARKLHEHIGGSRLVVIPEAGHLSNLEAPDPFTGALAEFLGEVV